MKREEMLERLIDCSKTEIDCSKTGVADILRIFIEPFGDERDIEIASKVRILDSAKRVWDTPNVKNGDTSVKSTFSYPLLFQSLDIETADIEKLFYWYDDHFPYWDHLIEKIINSLHQCNQLIVNYGTIELDDKKIKEILKCETEYLMYEINRYLRSKGITTIESKKYQSKAAIPRSIIAIPRSIIIRHESNNKSFSILDDVIGIIDSIARYGSLSLTKSFKQQLSPNQQSINGVNVSHYSNLQIRTVRNFVRQFYLSDTLVQQAKGKMIAEQVEKEKRGEVVIKNLNNMSTQEFVDSAYFLKGLSQILIEQADRYRSNQAKQISIKEFMDVNHNSARFQQMVKKILKVHDVFELDEQYVKAFRKRPPIDDAVQQLIAQHPNNCVLYVNLSIKMTAKKYDKNRISATDYLKARNELLHCLHKNSGLMPSGFSYIWFTRNDLFRGYHTHLFCSDARVLPLIRQEWYKLTHGQGICADMLQGLGCGEENSKRNGVMIKAARILRYFGPIFPEWDDSLKGKRCYGTNLSYLS